MSLHRATVTYFLHISCFPTCHHFPRFIIISEKSRPEVGNSWRWSSFFWKKDPLRENFQKNVSERMHLLTEPRLICKFCENWLTGNRQSRALFTWQKKTKLPQGLSLSLLHARIAPKICQGQLQTIYSEFPQISSKSVHFRRSYSRTREHPWNAPQSISNTRRSFFAE